MLQRVTFSQVDSTDEIARELNVLVDNFNIMENKVCQLSNEVELLKTKKANTSWVKKLLKPKEKGSVLMRILVCLIILALSAVCFGQYVPTDINSDIAANHDMLAQYLRDCFGNITSNSYLFTPTTTAPAVAEGKVYYNDDTDNLQLYTGSAWSTIDLAGGVSLDGAYDFGGAGSGKTITATDGAVTIQNTEADSASLLALSYTTGAQTGDAITITISGGTADGIEFENTGSGYDLEGTGAVWFMDKSGNLTCVDITTSDDVTFAGTNYDVSFDASADQWIFEDSAVCGFGGAHDAAADITLTYDGSGDDLNILFDDLEIAFGADGAGGDIYIYSETASHSALFSEANDELYMTHFDIQMDDNADLIIGSNDDWVIEDDTGDTLEILTKLTDGTAAINLGVDGAGADLKMFSETAGNYVEYDSTADEMYFEDCDLKLNEGAQLEFCYTDNATDWTIDLSTAERLTFTPSETDDTSTFHIGTATYTSDFHLFGLTANHTVWWDASAMIFYHGADADGHDVMWYGDTASSYMKWDEDGQTNGSLIFEAADLHMMDADYIIFGDGSDFTVHSTTTKILNFTPAAASDDYQVLLGSDQSGVDLGLFGTTASAYLLWDATADALWVEGADIFLGDSDLLVFGDAIGTGDIKMYATGTDFIIDGINAETGTVAIGVTDKGLDFKLWAATNAEGVLWDASDEALEFTGANLTLDAASVLTLGQTVNADIVVTTGTYAVLAVNSGKVHIIPDLAGDTAINLPAEVDGLYYKFIYCGAAADAHDHTIDSENNTNFFIGGVAFIDSDAGAAGDELSVVHCDGNSNSEIVCVNLDNGSVIEFHCDGTNWYLTGIVISDTTPTVADN